jgi:hypothetical protein
MTLLKLQSDAKEHSQNPALCGQNSSRCLTQEFRKPSAPLCIEKGRAKAKLTRLSFPWGECPGKAGKLL